MFNINLFKSSILVTILILSNSWIDFKTNAQCPGGSCQVPSSYAQTAPFIPQNYGDETIVVSKDIANKIRAASVITMGTTDSSGTSRGSGTLFVYNQSVGVLTAGHVVENSSYAYIRLKDKTIRCKVLNYDRNTDWAILEPESDQEELIQYAVPLVSTNPNPGERLILAGYGTGQTVRLWNGALIRYTYAMNKRGDWMVTQYAARPGDSGGGIFTQRGELVGNIWGTDGRQTYGTWIGATGISNICFFWRKPDQGIFGNWRERRNPPQNAPIVPPPSSNQNPVPTPPQEEKPSAPPKDNPPEQPPQTQPPQVEAKPDPKPQDQPEKAPITIIVERSLKWSGIVAVAVISAIVTVLLLSALYILSIFFSRKSTTQIP